MEDELLETPTKFSTFSRRSFIGTIIAGATAGILTFVLSRILETYIMTPALCGDAASTVCQNISAISFHTASIIAAIVAVVILVNASVYRPLLVAIAVVVGLWQSSFFSIGISWPLAITTLVAINIFAYLTFTWILRIYNLVFAILLTALVIVGLLFVSHLA